MNFAHKIYLKIELASIFLSLIAFDIIQINDAMHSKYYLNGNGTNTNYIRIVFFSILFFDLIIMLVIGVISNLLRLMYIMMNKNKFAKIIMIYRVVSIFTLVLSVVIFFMVGSYMNSEAEFLETKYAWQYVNKAIIMFAVLFYIYTMYIDLSTKLEVDNESLENELHENS